MQRLKINSSHVAALLLSVLLVFSHWREDALQTLTWDAFGYYIYLPTTLIQGDPTIQDPQPIRDLTDKYKLPVATIYYQPLENGRHVMKYSMGMAVLYSPGLSGGAWHRQGHGPACRRPESALPIRRAVLEHVDRAGGPVGAAAGAGQAL